MGGTEKVLSQSSTWGGDILIFVILGTQNIQFNRILIELDRLVEIGVIEDTIFAQTGYSTYLPMHYAFSPFVDMQQFQDYIEKSALIISHGGAGSLIASVKLGKKVIGIPRLKRYGEHVNDHQVELIEQFTSHGYILSVMEMSELEEALMVMENFVPLPYISSNSKILNILENFLEE